MTFNKTKFLFYRAAQDGANIVIAAKTVTPHPSLEGTIHTAAEEVRKAGGKCLACVCDIRYEDQIKKAIDETIKTFGGNDSFILRIRYFTRRKLSFPTSADLFQAFKSFS